MSIRRFALLFVIAFHAVARTSFAQAPAVATGDSRTVTEPTFPALCATQPPLLASFHDVNGDVPVSIETGTGGNTELDQARIQAALNACTSSGASVAVELSMDASGNNAFLTGPLTIPAGVTLLIDAGVTLYFSRNAQDYDHTPGTHTCGTVSTNSQSASCKNLITISANNVGIMGYGKMDGRGGDVILNSFVTPGIPIPQATPTWWDLANDYASPTSQQNPRFIQTSNASNLIFYKFTMKNAPEFHISISGGSNQTIWGIKIITPYTSHNTDGIDPANDSNLTITHVSGSDGDDNIALASTSSTSSISNVSVTHNRFFAGHGESIGSITEGTLSNILFDSNMNYGDADVDGSNSTAIRIKSADDRGGNLHNVQYSNSCFANHGTQIQFDPLYNTNAGTLTPSFSNILLQNLRFASGITGPGITPVATGSVTIQGATNGSTTNPITVTLDNVTMDTAPTLTSPNTLSDIYEAQITLGPGAVSSTLATPLLAASGSNGNVVTGTGAGTTVPPACTFTFLTPEITGPTTQAATITQGQVPTAAVILSPAEALAKFPYPTGTITLTDENSNVVATATLPGTGDTIFIPITPAPTATHTYTAAYSGDSVYPAITAANWGSSYTVTVNSGSLTATGIGLTGVPATASYGTSFTATATLTGTGTPTGSIEFLVDGAVYATVPIASKAASNTFTLPFGSYTLSAVYLGDSSNAAAVTPTSSIVIGAATTTTVIGSSATTSTVGTPVTLTATVSSVAGTPTGTMNFSYTIPPSTTPVALGTGTLSNGVATFSAFLPLGADNVAAAYVASGSFAASSSTNTVTVTVTAAPPVPDATLPLALPYTITTIAGGGATPPAGTVAAPKPCPSGGGTTYDALGDGCQATSILFPGTTTIDLRAVTADSFGNVYFVDGTNEVIHKIAPNGVMTDFAGLGLVTPACTPTATLNCNPLAVKFTARPRGVYADPLGNVFIAATGTNQVLEVKLSDGLMHLVAGNGTATSPAGASSDGPNALTATLNGPRAVATDAAGNVYIADTTNNRIREVVAATGAITTIVGTGASGSAADNLPGANLPATSATLSTAQGVAVDSSNNVYVAESSRVDAVCVTCAPGPSPLYSLLTKLGYTNIQNGNIYAVAGTGSGKTPGLGNTVSLAPQRVAIDPNGNLYISDGGSGTAGVADAAIWFEDGRTGFIHPIAGITGNTSGTAGTTAGSACTGGTATDTLGDGCIGTQGSLGDYIPGATSAAGFGVGLDYQGNVYISDTLDLRIRKVSNNLNFGSGPVGTAITKNIQIHFLPGDTPLTTTIETAASTEFTLGTPTCTKAADTTTDCVYAATFTPAAAGPRYAPLAITTTLNNPGTLSLTGFGTGAGATLDPANQIAFGQSLSPKAIAVDAAGNVYVADGTSKNVLKFTRSATANGTSAASTVLQSFMNPSALAVDSLGDLFVADATTGFITEITPSGTSQTLHTVFGSPDGLAVDSLNNLYVSDASAKSVTQIGSNLLTVRTIANTVLLGPAGVAVDGSGNIFVADPSAGTVFRYDGATLARTVASTAAAAPSAVAVDAAGNLIVADGSNNQILAIPAAAPVTPIAVASGIPGNTLAMDAAGNVFTNSGTNQVLELLRTQGAATYNRKGAAPSTFNLLSTGNTTANLSLTDPDTTNFGLTLGTTSSCTGTTAAIAVTAGGSCTFTSSFTPTGALNYVNTATFTGAANASLASPPTLEIIQTGNNAPYPTLLAIGASTPASPKVGDSITLNATIVSSFGTPAGTVTFSVDGTAITPASAVANGAAFATIASGLSAGNHTITAVFTSSDTNFANATATPVTLMVATNGMTSAIALGALSPASPAYGQAVTFSATVTGSTPAPAGTVVFTIDAATYNAAVNSGVAMVTVNGLSVGTHSLSAAYTSSNGYAPSTSTTQMFSIAKATLTVTPSCATRQFGAPNVCTATVTGYVSPDSVSTVFVAPPTGSTAALRNSPAGTYPVTAGSLALTSFGSANYVVNVASPTFVILGGSPQSILFPALPNFTHGTSYQLTARTTSGLPVTYTVTAGNSVASINGSILTVTGTGAVTIQATQSTDPTGDYAAAAPVSMSFTAQ